MANPQRGETELTIEGKSYVIKYPLGICAELMSEFDLKAISEIPSINLQDMNNLAKLLSLGIKGGGGDLSAKKILATVIPIPEAITAVSQSLVLSLIGESPPLAEKPVPKQKKSGTGK